MSNIEQTKFVRNANSIMIKDTLKILCFLILKEYRVLPFHKHENNTINIKHYYSEPFVYKTKNIARQIQQQNHKNNSFEQVQITKISVTVTNLMHAKFCMYILYRYP